MLGVLVVAAALFLILRSDAGPPPVVRGADAPPFDLPVLETADAQRPSHLSLEALRGRVVLLNIWASWCEPCEEEMPAMERLYQSLPHRDFELVAVSIDERTEDVRKFQERMHLTFPILLDPDGRVNAAYQTMGVPESLLIDRDGRIVERYVGPRHWDAPEYEARLRRLLQEGGGI